MQIGFPSYLLLLLTILAAVWGGRIDCVGRFLSGAVLIVILSRLFLAGLSQIRLSEGRRQASFYPQLLANGLLVSFVWAGGLSFLLYNLSFGRIDNLLPGLSSNMWGMLCIGLVPAGLILQTRSLSRIIGVDVAFRLVEFLSLSVFMTGALILTGLHRLSSESMLGLWILSLTLNAAGAVIIIWLKTSIRKAISLELLRETLISGMKPFWVDFLSVLNYFMPLLFCSRFLPWHQTGMFALTLVLSEAVWRTALFIKNRSPLAAVGSGISLRHFRRQEFSFCVRTGIWAGVFVLIVGGVLFGQVFRALFSEAWLLLFLVPGMVFHLITRLLSEMFEEGEDYFLLVSSGAIAFAVNFDLSLLLVGGLGLAGAGFTFFLTQAAMAVFYLSVYRKHEGLRTRELWTEVKTAAHRRNVAKGERQ